LFFVNFVDLHPPLKNEQSSRVKFSPFSREVSQGRILPVRDVISGSLFVELFWPENISRGLCQYDKRQWERRTMDKTVEIAVFPRLHWPAGRTRKGMFFGSYNEMRKASLAHGVECMS
jgi:hypothetical protein